MHSKPRGCMRIVVIAPNAFKNSLSAPDVADAIRNGLEQSSLNAVYETFPIGDGGDGTGTLLAKQLGARQVAAFVNDPLGRTVQSGFWIVPGSKTAIIEMASASGLRLVNRAERDPLRSSSYGTGELIRHALDNQVKKILLCIGGTATVDGGVGMLQALGVRFLDANRQDLRNIPESFVSLEFVDASNADARLRACEIDILCDVSNPLLGESGAAAVFAPQKGASPSDVQKLEAGLRKLSEVIRRDIGVDIASMTHGGAAGGAGAALYAFFGARLKDGTDYFLDITRFSDLLPNTDILITGEGSIDQQTLNGKAPFGVAKRAKLIDVPVIAIAGSVPATPDREMKKYFDVLISIQNGPATLEDAVRGTRDNIVRTACAVGNLLAFGYS